MISTVIIKEERIFDTVNGTQKYLSKKKKKKVNGTQKEQIQTCSLYQKDQPKLREKIKQPANFTPLQQAFIQDHAVSK
jgi:catabolite regulation protein CreA